MLLYPNRGKSEGVFLPLSPSHTHAYRIVRFSILIHVALFIKQVIVLRLLA